MSTGTRRFFIPRTRVPILTGVGGASCLMQATVGISSINLRRSGTGMWTSQEAMELQVPVPTIDAAVAMRDLSVFESDRVLASDQHDRDVPETPQPGRVVPML